MKTISISIIVSEIILFLLYSMYLLAAFENQMIWSILQAVAITLCSLSGIFIGMRINKRSLLIAFFFILFLVILYYIKSRSIWDSMWDFNILVFVYILIHFLLGILLFRLLNHKRFKPVSKLAIALYLSMTVVSIIALVLQIVLSLTDVLKLVFSIMGTAGSLLALVLAIINAGYGSTTR